VMEHLFDYVSGIIPGTCAAILAGIP